MKDKVNELKLTLKDKSIELENLKKEKTFDYEIKDMRSFFKNNGRSFSDLFCCASIYWCVTCFVKENKDNGGTKCLATYLRCENNYEGLNANVDCVSCSIVLIII